MKKLLLMILPLLSASVQAVSNEGEYGPAWSPDGRYIAYHKNSASVVWDLMVKDVQTGQITQVSKNSAYDTGASWSPDSKKLVFSSSRNGNRDIFIHDMTTGKTNALIEHESMDNQAEWSPDGKYVAFLSRRKGASQLYLYEFENQKITQLTDTEGQIFHPSWTLDSRGIVFDQTLENKSGIYKLDLNTGNIAHLYSNNSVVMSASLNDEWLTLTTNKAGNWDVIQINLVSMEEKALVSSADNEIKGVWDITGKHLAYSHQNQSGIWQLKILSM